MVRTLTLLTPSDPAAAEGSNLVVLDDLPIPLAPLRRIFDSVTSGSRFRSEGNGLGEVLRGSDAVRAESFTPPRILFFPSSDTHVKTFAPLIRRCRDPLVMVRRHVQHSEREALEQEGIAYEIHRTDASMFRDADVVLMGIDWGMEERVFIHHCRRHGLPVACLQESTNVDFDGPPHRMQWTDYALIQGTHALGYLDRQWNFLTGNPRFDAYASAPEPAGPRVLINCNFTFGLGVDWGRDWVDQVVDAATELSLPYAITVHPRDETDLSGLNNVLPSSAYKVGDQLSESTILVSRDSSLPYEALLMNRHAVYYNPFHEKERCLQEDDSGLIHKCDTPDDLRGLLTRLRTIPMPMDAVGDTEAAYRHLFTATDRQNYRRVLDALAIIAAHHAEAKPDDYRAEPYWKARWSMTLQQIIRPRLRRIPVARGLWRWGKRILGKA
jgi:hypothetical protein